MCGIAGYFDSNHDIFSGRNLVYRMVQAISHRGPDAQGFHVEGNTGLGHSRLSVIDLANGQQPMSDPAGDLWLTYNGEIFNYLELREELEAKGHHFRTESDTEVILHLYHAYGESFLDQLNGDFAFALWDRRRRKLVLVRDRVGVRPLYYVERPDGLYFASEIKALLEVPGVDAELDPIALDQIFTLWSTIAPRTIFKGVRELLPGHYLIAEDRQVRVRPYWRLEFSDRPDHGDKAEAELAEELRELLIDATRIRLRSDVPVGSYLSGGLDSSIVSAIAAKLSPERLRTFSIQFESAEYDESDYQRAMVAALGTQHSAVLCTTSAIARDFPNVIRHAEQPILRTGPAPLFALSRQVREAGYKVVLTGEGADEVFAGYDLFKEAKVRRFCARQPNSQSRLSLLRRLYPYLPKVQCQSVKYLGQFFGTGLDDTSDPLYSHLPRFKSTAGAKIFFSTEMREAIGCYDPLQELRDRLPEDFRRWHPLSQAQYLELTFLLPGYILSSQGDRAAMAHGIEGRFPFLDHRVIAFATRIPVQLRLKGLREKHLLRESAKALLPESIRDRPKQPYRAPDSQSFTRSARPATWQGAMSISQVKAAGYFNPSAVEKLATKAAHPGLSGFRDNAAFVGILSAQIWHDQFVSRRSMGRGPELLVEAV